MILQVKVAVTPLWVASIPYTLKTLVRSISKLLAESSLMYLELRL